MHGWLLSAVRMRAGNHSGLAQALRSANRVNRPASFG